MYGLKNVRRRRTDALARVGWERLEALVASCYRDAGYTVDHCGTGASGSCTDGGIDLKLRRGDQYIVVQCKHWNAKQVPHNDVHQLLGLMVNEGATGAILVTSGEFTAAARKAAEKLGHVQLVDGDALRRMLGPLPEPASAPGVFDSISLSMPSGVRDVGERIAGQAGERLLRAAEDRIRHEGRRAVARATHGLVRFVVLKLVAAGLFILLAWYAISTFFDVVRGLAPQKQVQPAHAASASPPMPVANWTPTVATADPDTCRELVDAPSGTYIDHCAEKHAGPSPAELRELQRRADEAAKVLEHSTPEM